MPAAFSSRVGGGPFSGKGACVVFFSRRMEIPGPRSAFRRLPLLPRQGTRPNGGGLWNTPLVGRNLRCAKAISPRQGRGYDDGTDTTDENQATVGREHVQGRPWTKGGGKHVSDMYTSPAQKGSFSSPAP